MFFKAPVPPPIPDWRPSTEEIADSRRHIALQFAVGLMDSSNCDKLLTNAKKIESYLKGSVE